MWVHVLISELSWFQGLKMHKCDDWGKNGVLISGVEKVTLRKNGALFLRCPHFKDHVSRVPLFLCSGDWMETIRIWSKVSETEIKITLLTVISRLLSVFCRSTREMELDNDFDKLTSVLRRLLAQVKVCPYWNLYCWSYCVVCAAGEPELLAIPGTS